MKLTRLLCFSLLSAVTLLSSCNQTKKITRSNIGSDSHQTSNNPTNNGEGIYDLYVEDGGTFSYSEWVQVLKRGLNVSSLNIDSGTSTPSSEKGESGDVYIDVESWDFYLKIGSEWTLMGNIKVEEQGLFYYLLDNGSYAVGLGNAKYLSNITIPSVHFGKTVTMIADSFYPSNMSEQSLNIQRTIKFPSSIQKIGEFAFYSVPNKTVLDIPYSLAQFEDFTFGSSWCNSYVDLKLTDQTISIKDVFDTLTVTVNPSVDVGRKSKLSIVLSTTRYGGISQKIRSFDENFTYIIDNNNMCSISYSEDENAYVLNCSSMGNTTIHFSYNELHTDFVVNVVSDSLFDNALRVAAHYNNAIININSENIIEPSSPYNRCYMLLSKTYKYIDSSTVVYEFTYEHNFRAAINGNEVDVSNYIDEIVEINTNDTEKHDVVFFKNFPSINADSINYPRIYDEITVRCNGISKKHTVTFVLYPMEIAFEHVSISDIFEHMTFEGEDSYLQNVETGAYNFKDAIDIETQGKLVYISPDNNFGIIQDGNNFIQLYQISDVQYLDGIKNDIVGQNIIVKGRITSGSGNPQIAYVSEIRKVRDGDTTHAVGDCSSFVFDQTKLSNLEWWNNPIFSQVGIATEATVIDGTLYKVVRKGGNLPEIEEIEKSNIDVSRRHYEFYVEINGETVRVITNYHTCSDANGGLTPFGNSLRTFLQTKLVPGQKINIGGFISWENVRFNNDLYSRSVLTDGTWTITPFLSSHLE